MFWIIILIALIVATLLGCFCFFGGINLIIAICWKVSDYRNKKWIKLARSLLPPDQRKLYDQGKL